MESFYIIVLVIAFVFLLFCLIVVGIMLQKAQKSDVFPPTASPCPDGWLVKDISNCKMSTANNGIGTSADYSTNTTYIPLVYNMDSTKTVFNFTGTLCDKQKWANNYSINWDGVTNYTKC
jgi:hypothetical protein